MIKKNYLEILNNLDKDDNSGSTFKKHDRVLFIDGLNLFLRNFAMINFVNEKGIHTGGLGGFLRSLGSLINLIKPTSVYITFDGIGSSNNRKNLIPEYKSGRHTSRVTNWDVFGNLTEENESKINQIVRLIHYLKCLPLKVISLDKTEADDLIAFLSKELAAKHNSKVFIVSADQDFAQLIDSNITLYRPLKKEFFTPDKVKAEYGVLAENFIIYKTLIGDNSDKMPGVKGLGKGKLLKLFPDLANKKVTLEDILKISEEKYKDNLLYSKIVFNFEHLQKQYKVMDLHNPILDENEKEFLKEFIKEPNNTLDIASFLRLYNEDGLNNTIKNPDFWLRDTFKVLNSFK